ncbi:hypothetical protein NOR_08753 [Metarhizium rileyi]|uniref:Uncharacterized protein n=1 Tax=Metarhizium rileyi (strain RCEF 4871) TaxID=1649241 RepID=A0A166VPT3_METRR|nr:hypothetical protein NOR_08753 [Metarhizium rileyi RCEF 4871]
MDTLRSPNRRPDAEALSIYELVRRQPRKRILIEPLLWTRLHLDILSCTFSQSNPAPQAMMHLPPIKNAFIVASRRRLFERHFFGLGQLWVAKEGSIRGSLASEPSPLSWRRDLYLYFGSRCSVLPCHYYCLDNIPVAAHVDRSRIMSQRKKRVARVGDRYNPPVWSLGSLKLKKITPTEPLHDPYLVALLIALGQLQWGTLEPQKTRQAAGVTEASQQEASQQEASQQEASQQEASQQEASQQEASQQEASQQEASQQEASQQEASQQEASQQEASQQEASQQEASQQEASQQEASQQEASQQEASQQEASQQEASQQEASQQEASQQEASQQEASQQEASQQEASQQEASQQEASQQEASQQEASQQEASQQEASQQEASQQEASQQEASQQEASQQEASQQEASQSIQLAAGSRARA